MDGTHDKPEFNKWGGLLSFGAGRKRLIIAFCALSIMIIAMVVVIKLTPENEVRISKLSFMSFKIFNLALYRCYSN